MNLDEELRGTLLERAEHAPPGGEMLDGVRGRARRITRRRRTVAAGLATVVVVTGAVAMPYTLSHWRADRDSGTPAPVATLPPPPAEPPSAVPLAPAALEPLTFPLTPDWTPPGAGTPTIGRLGATRRLVYETTGLVMIVEVSPSRHEWEFTPTKTEHTTIGSQPATIVSGTAEGKPAAGITWRLADGRWVAAASYGGLTTEQIKRYAQSLRAAPLPPAILPFTLALAPRGFQINFAEIHPTEFFFCLAPKDVLEPGSEKGMCLRNNAAERAPDGKDVTVGRDPGQITRSDGITRLDVYRPGFPFSVSVQEGGPLNEADLIRFAAGLGKR